MAWKWLNTESLLKKLVSKYILQIHMLFGKEVGANEKTNGLIRRYFPKGTDFNNVTAKQLKYVQDKLDNRLRTIINYKTPSEIFK